MKVNDKVRTYYRGRVRECRVVKFAAKKSQRAGESYWWLECNGGDVGSYHRRFMKPQRLIQSAEKGGE